MRNIFKLNKTKQPPEIEMDVLVMDEEISQEKIENPSVQRVTKYYEQKRNSFLDFFDQEHSIFEERAKLKLFEIEYALNQDYYTETSVRIGGIECHIRDDHGIKNHYDNLRKERTSLLQLIQSRRTFAKEQRTKFMVEAQEAMKLEQRLNLEELCYETILPTHILQEMIYPLPLYVFKDLDTEGNFVINIDDYGYGRDLLRRLISSYASENYLAKRICFGKIHLLEHEVKPSGKLYEIKGNIIFPLADRSIQDKIVKFYHKGYKPYTIAHEDAFSVIVTEHNLPKKDPIPAVDVGNMTVLIAQYGDFEVEKELIENTKAWFNEVHQKCFSLN